MSRFQLLKLSSVEKLTSNSVLLSFQIDDSLKDAAAFAFMPGQHIAIRCFLDENNRIMKSELLNSSVNKENEKMPRKSIVRNYSICSTVFDRDLQVAVKKVPGGLFSNFANDELRAGDSLEVLAPSGLFTPSFFRKKESLGSEKKPVSTWYGLSEKLFRSHLQLVAFAAGSGITPIMSMIKTFLTMAEERKAPWRCSLFYGNKTSDDCMFKEELYDLKNNFVNRFRFFLFFSKQGMSPPIFQGRLNADTLTHLQKAGLLSSDDTAEYYLSGPGDMIATISSFLEANGIEKKAIKKEHFSSAYVQDSKEVDLEKAMLPGLERMNPMPHRKIDLESKKMKNGKLDIEYEGMKASIDFLFSKDGIIETNKAHVRKSSLLDLALTKLDLPHACKGGVCGTCRARLIRGKVQQKLNYALTEEEIRSGQILTCQSHPLSHELELNYDIL